MLVLLQLECSDSAVILLYHFHSKVNNNILCSIFMQKYTIKIKQKSFCLFSKVHTELVLEFNASCCCCHQWRFRN